jgi:hypothetical protein
VQSRAQVRKVFPDGQRRGNAYDGPAHPEVLPHVFPVDIHVFARSGDPCQQSHKPSRAAVRNTDYVISPSNMIFAILCAIYGSFNSF